MWQLTISGQSFWAVLCPETCRNFRRKLPQTVLRPNKQEKIRIVAQPKAAGNVKRRIVESNEMIEKYQCLVNDGPILIL